MAVKTGIITINGIQAIECDSDPSIGGLSAAIGSYASATDGSGIFYKSASSNTSWTQVIMPSTIPSRITNLENNVYKVTYFQIVTGTSGSVTIPTGATINTGQFGSSGNSILSKIDISNQPTLQSPVNSGGIIVTANIDTNGNWIASGVYTDTSVAIIYSLSINALNYHNLDNTKIVNEVQQNSLTSTEFGNFIFGQVSKSTLADNDEFIISDSADSNKSKGTLWSNIKTNLQTFFNSNYLKINSNLSDLNSSKVARVNLGLDKGTNGGNVDYSILSTDKTVYTGTPFTTARTWTLPDASTVNPWYEIIVEDALQTVTSTNTLTIAVQSGQFLNGTLNGTEVIQSAGGWRRLTSNGVNGWTFDNGVVRMTKTQTISNKRIVPRVTTIVSSATPTINTDNCDAVTITALAADITSMTTNLSGTPNNFDKLTIRIKDNGTARAITWGASFANYGGVLPTTTVINKTTTVGLQWDSVALVWACLASVTQP